jgi:hypothetical protein
VEPARVKFTLGALPKLAGIDTPVLASGAIVRLNPTLARLARAHGAFSARTLADDPCLELRAAPSTSGGGDVRWELFATLPYVPVTTVEGPWTGARRDGLRALCVRLIDAVAPGFGASVEAATILHPKESETVMDPHGAAVLTAKAALDVTGVPEIRAAGAASLAKGLSVLEPSLYAGEGDAGIVAADLAQGFKGRADA